MAPAILLLLVAQAAAPAIEDLAHESRTVRDAALRRLVEEGPPSAELAARLDDPDDRIALGVAEVLRRRRDRGVIAPLVRAADGADATRAAAAAAALVATAGAARLDVTTLRAGASDRLPARLDAAYRDLVRATLLPLRHHPSVDRPQRYRDFHAGGEHAARALLDLAGDGGAPAPARAHAVHAYARLAGEGAQPALLRMLDAAEPLVREEAAALLLRYGDDAALGRLAALLDEGRTLQPPVLHAAALAVRRTGRVGPQGAATLERLARAGRASLAVDAAAALAAAGEAAAAPALRARVARHLARAERAPGSGIEAGLFELRVGPLPDDLRARMRAVEDPLLRACAADGDALADLRLALAASPGRGEIYRTQIVAGLLARHDAPPRDRVAFATRALASDMPDVRRAGLEILRPVDPAAWAALRPRVVAALDDGRESVRLAAAAILLPERGAIEVCADVLYDGDPWSARRVAALVARAGDGFPAVRPGAGIAERRRTALELGRAAGRHRE